MPPLHYVILRHDGIPDPHYDLMFEREPGGPLLTLRSPNWPILNPTPVEPLPDHRRDYLDYEGPVSNNRGDVRRVQSGTYQGEFRNGLMPSHDLTLLTPERAELQIHRIIDRGFIVEPRQPRNSGQQ